VKPTFTLLQKVYISNKMLFFFNFTFTAQLFSTLIIIQLFYHIILLSLKK